MENTTYIYNCKRCKTGKRVEYQQRDVKGIWVQAKGGGKPIVYGGDTKNGICPNCNRMMSFGELKARFVDTVECGPRCTSARGHSCDCACGGANHGSGH